MHVWIELLALWGEFRNAILLKHLKKLTLGEFNAFYERLHLGVGSLAQLGPDRFQRPVHVVRHRQYVAGKPRDTIESRIENLALGSFAQILHFRERAQQFVLELGGFAPGFYRRVGRLWSRGALSLSHGFSLAGGSIRHRAQSILGNIWMPGISGLLRQKSSV